MPDFGAVMANAVALFLVAAFAVLGLWHVWMAFRPAGGASAAVPSVEGVPLFAPSRKATLAVATVLFLFAGLVAATGGLVTLGLPRILLVWASSALALGLAARAVGDFRYVGFFKRVRGSAFARMDTLVYSPICVILALGTAYVAHAGAT